MFLKNLFFLLLGMALVVALTSCRRLQRVVYYHTEHVNPTAWSVDYPVVFSLDSARDSDIEDGNYHVYLVIRYRESYPNKDLYLRLEQTSLSRGVEVKEIRINMEHPGDNAGAEVKLNKGLVELALPVGMEYIDQRWTLSVEQRMAPPPLRGINDIGVKIVK